MPAIGLFTGVLTTSTNASALGACTQVLAQWGTRGGQPGQFRRPEALVVDDSGGLIVVDADNDRLQRFRPGV